MRLVGRDAELTRIASAIAAAASGGAPDTIGVVSISGEAGIGKTRLAAEAVAAAKQRGFTVLAGTAYPLGTAIAYGPLLEALGNYLRALSAVERARATSGLEDLGRLFPGLVSAHRSHSETRRSRRPACSTPSTASSPGWRTASPCCCCSTTPTGPTSPPWSSSQFGKVRAGDVLVCPTTSPVWSILFPSIGALVTDTGGALSQPAIIAREYGIAAVVATDRATGLIHDGDTVRVDGGRGVVEVLR